MGAVTASLLLYRGGDDVKQRLGVTESQPPLSCFVTALLLNLELCLVSGNTSLTINTVLLLPEKVKLP